MQNEKWMTLNSNNAGKNSVCRRRRKIPRAAATQFASVDAVRKNFISRDLFDDAAKSFYFRRLEFRTKQAQQRNQCEHICILKVARFDVPITW